MCVCTYALTHTWWGLRTTCKNWLSPSTTWSPGIEFRLSSLVTSTFTSRAISLTPCLLKNKTKTLGKTYVVCSSVTGAGGAWPVSGSQRTLFVFCKGPQHVVMPQTLFFPAFLKLPFFRLSGQEGPPGTQLLCTSQNIFIPWFSDSLIGLSVPILSVTRLYSHMDRTVSFANLVPQY